jgi:hypothetical protein
MSDKNRANETLEERVDRLYRKNYQKLQNNRKNLDDRLYGQYNFTPRINEKSRITGKEHSIEELARRSNYSRSQSPINKSEDYTFQPKINDNNRTRSNYDFSDNMTDRINNVIKSKEHKIEKLRK